MDKFITKRDRDQVIGYEGQLKDIRLQLNEQLRCLDTRLETQVGIVYELQDFFRRKAEVESEYSKALDKLSKTLLLKHKEQKQKREGWSLFSTSGCWKELVDSTRREGRDHAALADIYSTHLVQKLAAIADDLQRVYRRCREISYENHEEILKVLHELHTTMKTYQSYQAEFKSAENKLRVAQNQRLKLEQTIAPEKLQKSKKFRLIEKEIDKRKNKYNDARLKALKARNDYLLSMDAANASLHKYFVDDLSDIIDCMDLGFHQAVANAIGIHLAAEECIKQSKQLSIDGMSTCIGGFDSRLDKQKFLEANNQAFMIPKKFEFQGPKGDDPMQISVTDGVKEDVEGRFKQLCKRLTKLKTESEEIWKTLETAEKKLLEMVSEVDFNVQCQFVDSAEGKLTEAEAAKKRAQLLETEDFHLAKFRKYVLEGNLIARLEAKYELMRNALGNDLAEAVSKGQGHHLLASLPAKPRRKRIGRPLTVGQPKLFGGSLEEYLEATEEEIPLIMKSCIRVINLYGLHHQGVFRVSGSQVEIQHFKEAFERGEDPLVDISDASDINSVAGVLKLYLRQLREPLFPIVFFDQLMELAQLESKHEFVMRVRSMVQNLPRPVFVVMRYLFAFLNHLSEFSDENMMDPYNLAICFGPTLVPIPEDKDRIQFQNLGNELVKNIIIYNEDIFSNDGGIMYEKYISSSMPDEGDVGEAPDQSHEDLDSETYPSEDDAASKEKDISLQLFTKSEVLEAVAQFDFTARTPRELSFKKGETLTLYAQVSSDWWRGSSLGQDGLIPDKYILLKIRDEDRERVEPRAPCEDGVRRRASSSSDSVLSGQPGGNVQYASSETSEMPSSSSRSKSLEGSTDSLSLDESSLGPGGRRRSYETAEAYPEEQEDDQEEEYKIEPAVLRDAKPRQNPKDEDKDTGSAESLSRLSDLEADETQMELDSALAQVLSAARTLEEPTMEAMAFEPQQSWEPHPILTSKSAATLPAMGASHRRHQSLEASPRICIVSRYEPSSDLSLDGTNFRANQSLWEQRANGGKAAQSQPLLVGSPSPKIGKRRELWDQHKKLQKQTPDLVMDLPIDTLLSSSPKSECASESDDASEQESSSSVNLDSPEVSAAERFAKSNQCTLKKNRGSGSGQAGPNGVDAGTQTQVPASRNSGVKEMADETASQQLLDAPPEFQGPRVMSRFPQLAQAASTASASQQLTPRPHVKVKPQVLKKPSLPQKPSPELSRKNL